MNHPSVSQAMILEQKALSLLAFGDFRSKHLALEILIEMDILSTRPHESDLATIQFEFKKFLAKQDELTELAVVAALRFFDRAYWINLRSVEQFHKVGYLDRMKAINDLRAIFKDGPWRVSIEVESIVKKATNLWEVRGEIKISDLLLEAVQFNS